MSTSDAAEREADWLRSVDSLPSLRSEDGGPWDIVQKYWPGARENVDKHGLYVDSRHVADLRATSQRIRPQYQITLTLIWPVKGQGTAAGASGRRRLAETEQQNLDNAAALIIERIRGFTGDKTHGGRFLSVAENPRTVNYTKEDPAVTIPQHRALYGSISYRCDDYEVTG